MGGRGGGGAAAHPPSGSYFFLLAAVNVPFRGVRPGRWVSGRRCRGTGRWRGVPAWRRGARVAREATAGGRHPHSDFFFFPRPRPDAPSSPHRLPRPTVASSRQGSLARPRRLQRQRLRRRRRRWRGTAQRCRGRRRRPTHHLGGGAAAGSNGSGGDSGGSSGARRAARRGGEGGGGGRPPLMKWTAPPPAAHGWEGAPRRHRQARCTVRPRWSQTLLFPPPRRGTDRRVTG